MEYIGRYVEIILLVILLLFLLNIIDLSSLNFHFRNFQWYELKIHDNLLTVEKPIRTISF